MGPHDGVLTLVRVMRELLFLSALCPVRTRWKVNSQQPERESLPEFSDPGT